MLKKRSISHLRFSSVLAAGALTLGFLSPAAHAATVNVPAAGLTVTTAAADTYVTDNTDTANPSILTFSNVPTGSTFTGQIQGNIGVNIAMADNGKDLYFNGEANNFTGGVTITTGRVFQRDGNELGVGTITLKNGTLFSNYNPGSAPIINNNIVLESGTATIRCGWGSAANSNNVGKISMTLNGVISGAAKLQFGNEPTPGKIILNNTNTYTGGTLINYAVRKDNYYQYAYFNLNSDQPFGTGTVTCSGTLQNASTDVYDANLKTVFELEASTSARNVQISNLTIDAGRTLSLTKVGTNTAKVTVGTLGGSGVITGDAGTTLAWNGTADQRWDGRLGGAMDFRKTSSKSLYFHNSGTSDYTGNIYLDSGILGLFYGTETGTGTIFMANGTHLMNTEKLNSTTHSNPVIASNIVVADGKAVTIRAGWGALYHPATSITTNGVISGSGVTVNYASESTPGRLNINGANTYSGTTNIDFALRWNSVTTGNRNRYQYAFFGLGSDTPFGTSTVNVKGRYDDPDTGVNTNTLMTLFRLENSTENRNVTIPTLFIDAGRTLKATQASTAHTANITVQNLTGTGTLSNVLTATEETTYGKAFDSFTIERASGSQETAVILNGDFDLHIKTANTIGVYQVFTGTANNYTGDIYLESGLLATKTGSKAIGTGTIHMSDKTHLLNYNGNSSPVYDNNIEVISGTVNIRGGWGSGVNYNPSKLTLNGDISGNAAIDFAQEPTPIPILLNGNNTYSGGTKISTYGIRGDNRYPYNYFVLGSDSPFGTGAVTVSNPTRMEFNTLTSDRVLKNDVTVNSSKKLYVSAVGANTAYLNGDYTIASGSAMILLNPKSNTFTDTQTQVLNVPDGNISRFSLSAKDAAAQAGHISGDLTVEKDTILMVNGDFNGVDVPSISGKLTLQDGSSLLVDMTNVQDLDSVMLSMNSIDLQGDSKLKLTGGSAPTYQALEFLNGTTLSDLADHLVLDYGWAAALNGNVLTLTQVPEPSTLALGFLALGGLFLFRKNTSKKFSKH